ncbi:FAD-dependent monooxygenase [Streptomyces sp. NPDC047928]|uniref:FAD-dependent monooxygenase n=1 Tax=unclassified Streptomyces TaxID=2593676 RepID=UPI0037186448
MSAHPRSASASHDTPVLVVGAGPVGSVLALELARYGVASIVVERSLRPSPYPKMDYVNGRSMELLRRLGLAEEIRSRGVARDQPSNFLFARGYDEAPIAIWRYPSVAETAARYAAAGDGSEPLEAYQRVRGSLLEDVVRGAAREHPLIDLREGWTFTGLDQGPGGVTATVAEGDGGAARTLRARFLVACDGAGSAVRDVVGVPLDVAAPPTRHCSLYFRSSDPLLNRHGRNFLTVTAKGLNLVSRDGADTWTASFRIADGEPFPADPVAVMYERFGCSFTVDELLNVSQWQGSLSVARAYREGAVFLAGDCAHQFYPVGGHGANTGLGDAVDLGWKLAAVVGGWGGPALLDSYEAERRPVALFNREMCVNLMEVWRRFAQLTSIGATREQLAGFLEQEDYQLDNVGIHHGYRYAGSPVVSAPDGPAPRWEWRRVSPKPWPGGRLPSIRLAGGAALFDRLGTGLTLLDLSGTGDGVPAVKEAERRGLPVTRLALDDAAAIREAWGCSLVLVRPDQHVAWQGDTVPDDWDAVLDRVTGH